MSFFKRLFGKKTTPPAPKPKRRERSYPDFPEGEGNHIDDPDIKTIEDMQHHYILPQGYVYRIREDGSPYILRSADSMEFKILVEAELMTFDEPYNRGDGRIGYKTTEIFKKM